jgi:hypothetical protein
VTKTYRIRKEGGVRPVAEKENPRAYEKFPSRHPLDSGLLVLLSVDSRRSRLLGILGLWFLALGGILFLVQQPLLLLTMRTTSELFLRLLIQEWPGQVSRYIAV